jgi:predicted DNA-binding ribbon-helix-helix protein
MEDRPAPGQAIEPDKGEGDDYVPVFRAVRHGDVRRGLRLERIYWNVLKEISRREGIPVGAVIDRIAGGASLQTNLTSAVRVNLMQWLSMELEHTRSHVGLRMVDRLVQACPSPVFALQEDRRIVAYNQAFLNFIQARFSRFSTALIGKGLRLALDMPIAELVATLLEADNRPVITGFAVGMDDQRLRGRISVILAPNPEKHTILGYILP